MRPSRRYIVFVHVMATIVAVVVLAPFAWLVISSVASQGDLLARPLQWIPAHPSLRRYGDIFLGSGTSAAGAFRTALLNSVTVAVVTVAIALTVGTLGAYAYARLRFPFRRTTLIVFLTTYMVPPIALVIPMYLIMARLHLLDTKAALIVVYCSFITPFVLWIMSNFFSTLPPDLEDAARVDGCTRLGAMLRVMLPLAKPGLLATLLFGFLLCWDEFLYALIFTSSLRSKTITVAIAEFSGRHSVDFGLVAAGGILAALPPVIIAVLFQRYLLGGLAAGAVKG
ncbi:MAG: carbohydrate ABC transporter permease [Streptosporangiaceae bacterium]